MTEWLSPIRNREWLEDDGSWWVLRPWYKVDDRKLCRLIRDPGLRVVEFSEGYREIPVAARADFVDELHANCAGYHAGDFRDQHGNRLILVEKNCY